MKKLLLATAVLGSMAVAQAQEKPITHELTVTVLVDHRGTDDAPGIAYTGTWFLHTAKLKDVWVGMGWNWKAGIMRVGGYGIGWTGMGATAGLAHRYVGLKLDANALLLSGIDDHGVRRTVLQPAITGSIYSPWLSKGRIGLTATYMPPVGNAVVRTDAWIVGGSFLF